VWRDSVTLWIRAVALEPGNRFARINLGGAYAAAGRVPEAIDQYRQVLTLSPDKAPWYEVLAGSTRAAATSRKVCPCSSKPFVSSRDGPAPASTRAKPCACSTCPRLPKLEACPPPG
jgi:Cytochrome c biogenesis factor